MRSPLLIFGPTLALGLVGLLVSLGSRGGDAGFIFDQQHPASIEHVTLEHAVVVAREPLPGNNGLPGRQARCQPGTSQGSLHNPWSCAVLYPSGRTVHYILRVLPNGIYHGESTQRNATIDGHVRAPNAG